MPKLHQVTIPHSVFAEIQHWLAEPAIRSPFGPRLALATMLAPMIGHIRLFQTTKDKRPNVLEWSIHADTGAVDFPWEPADLVAGFEQLKNAIEKLSNTRNAGDVHLYLGLSLDPSDKSLSIDVTTDPVLEGEDLAARAAASMAETSPQIEELHAPPDDIYFTASKAAQLLGVDKSTITRRIGNNQLIGFRIFKNALRIPKEQFRDGDVVDGIANILSLFKIDSVDGTTFLDHKAAWTFLTSTIYPGDVAPRPIDRLRATSIDRSVSAVLEELALAKQSLDYGDHV